MEKCELNKIMILKQNEQKALNNYNPHMIRITHYPRFQFKNISYNEGTSEKEVLLSKSFLTPNNSTVLIPEKAPFSVSKPTQIRLKRNGFLLEILFNGLNYANKRIKRMRPKYYSDTHRSEFFTCEEAPANTFKSLIYKRRIVFFSYDHNMLVQLERLIKAFRPPNIYTGKGLYTRDDIYRMKKMKKRK